MTLRKHYRIVFGRGSAPDPAEGAYDAPPDSLYWGEETFSPLPSPSRPLYDRSLEPLQRERLASEQGKATDQPKIYSLHGHELTAEGVKPDDRKIKAIMDMPRTADRTALMRLLGMATYLAKFVPNFSEVTGKLRELLSQDVEFCWIDSIHGRALQQLKQMLANAPVLKYYDVRKPVTIQTDASGYGCGSTCLQDGLPVEYASRSLTRVETESYAQIKREMAAIVSAVKRFHTYIYGKRDVTVITDHRPLISVFKKPLGMRQDACRGC